MIIDGQCHCGRIRFTAHIDRNAVEACHCTDCQALTGSPMRVTAMAAADQVTIEAGTPRLYVKRGDNGRQRLQYFCGDCGAPLFTTGEGDDAATWGIRWGSIRQRHALAPRRRIWCRSAPDWLDGLGALPCEATE